MGAGLIEHEHETLHDDCPQCEAIVAEARRSYLPGLKPDRDLEEAVANDPELVRDEFGGRYR